MKRPLMATGDVVENYEPLFIYWRKAKERSREDLVERTLIREEDLRLLEKIVEEKISISLEDVINVLVENVVKRVDADIAEEALREYGVDLSKEEARNYIARIVAGWIVEAGEVRGIVSIRRSWNASKA